MARLYSDAQYSHEPGPTLIAACTHGEHHEVGLRMICDLLEYAGWETSYLGAAVPVESLLGMVRERRPDVLALSVSTLPHVNHAKEMITQLRQLGGRTPLIAVGGRPFMQRPALAQRVGADITAADAAELVIDLTQRFPGR